MMSHKLRLLHYASVFTDKQVDAFNICLKNNEFNKQNKNDPGKELQDTFSLLNSFLLYTFFFPLMTKIF